MTIKYPKGETVLLFIMTSKPLRDYYYLYELIDGEFKKLGRATTPTELEEKFKVHEKMSVQSV